MSQGTFDPGRSELYGVDRLEQAGALLAASHEVLPRRQRGRALLTQLRRSRAALLRAWQVLSAAAQAGEAVAPAAEWLIENFHIVEDQLREIGRDLPPGFYDELPKLASGAYAGLPRVYALVATFVEHTESRFDLTVLRRFVMAYQGGQVLKIGELWAIAISLRLVLVEKLRRTVDVVLANRAARAEADTLADALLSPARAKRAEAHLRALGGDVLPGSFVVQLVQRMRDRDPATTPGLVWLEARLAQQRSSVEEMVREEHLKQAALQGPVRDAITAMRALALVDWGEFVETVCLVEHTLRDAPDVLRADFATRDAYRHAVEALARRSAHTELEVAQAAVRLAGAAELPPGSRGADPGYHLIGRGRGRLEAELGYRPPLRQRIERRLQRAPWISYLGGLTTVTLGWLAIPVVTSLRADAPVPELALLSLLALTPASELAMAVVNRVVVRLVGPRKLPQLELKEGVPPALRTLVVVPALLLDAREVQALLERLEVHFLANDEGELRFALATDWRDAPAEHAEGDEALLAQVRAGVAQLNALYGPAPAGGPRFFSLHRGRRWNASEACWMGWERKRGKLHELNALLRGATETSFLPSDEAGTTPAEIAALEIRYVITLDTDTSLPRGAAKKLIGAIAHPLNRPLQDAATGDVSDGYSILQPAIKPTLPEAGAGTLIQRAFSGPAGLEPYTFASSDVYQDLFGEGSYVGKGIYDINMFEVMLSGRAPDNTLLSHDLFEGLHARSGFVSDVALFEAFPAHYQVLASRQHRWARGDWQLLPWIFARGPISRIGRWKMLDNLRRSLVAPTCVATLIVAWALPDGRLWAWTLFIAATLSLPTAALTLLAVVPCRSGLVQRVLLRRVGRELLLAALRVSLSFVLLAEQATLMVDAIVRTVFRLTVSHRRRLEWVTAGQVALGCDLAIQTFYRKMWPGVALGVATLAAVPLLAPEAAGVAIAFSLLWITAPLTARALSTSPHARTGSPLSHRDARYLRLTARHTWRYFTTWVTAAEHHLPPDNFQEDPQPVVAHRTSPTNIGLYLLSAVSAHDMGWISDVELLDRAEATLRTLQAMERHRGHFYNWYDTTTLAPLPPRYISTVDSGNLAGHLLVLQQALLELVDQPPSVSRACAGLRDTLLILQAAIAVTVDDRRAGVLHPTHLAEAADELGTLLEAGATGQGGDLWDTLLTRADVIADCTHALSADRREHAYHNLHVWAQELRSAVLSHARDHLERRDLAARAARAQRLAAACEQLSVEHDWPFLFHHASRLFAIGYNVTDSRLDGGSYDLLASECRLASFVAISVGAVPVSHWFHLGRRLTTVGSGSALLSWSGSMFEYLMPELVMATPAESMLGETVRRAVQAQVQHGRQRGVPWGVSEACYNVRDLDRTYQYSNFGVSALGLRPGLAEDVVIAPYATALAAMFNPVAAVQNFLALERVGASGQYGFYEAIDFTLARLPDHAPHVVVRSYMAHHQGMSVVALCNVLTGFPMRRRFHTIARVRSAELLLQERAPRDVENPLRRLDNPFNLHVRAAESGGMSRSVSPYSPVLATHRLSNGSYSVSITAAGGGSSTWNGYAITRWREDNSLDRRGTFVYIRDVDRGRVWSAGLQPSGAEPDSYEASFFEHHVEIQRQDGSLATTLDIVVASEDDAELRQLTIVNHGIRVRNLELTSYAEIVLTTQAADLAHPAFSNLFVRTEFDVVKEALLASRRPRSVDEPELWAAHMSVVHGVPSPGVQFETDRARFLGRGHDVRTASAVHSGAPLSDTVGAVLDPIFSLRRRVSIEPGETIQVMFATLVGPHRDQLISRCDAYREIGAFERTLHHAWTYAQIQLQHLGIDSEAAQLYQRLGSRSHASDPAMRAPRDVLQRNQLGQSTLWRFGISGDRPLLLARIRELDDHDLVRQLVHALCYLRLKGLTIDLVLLNEFAHTYTQDRMEVLEGLVRASHLAGLKNNVYVLRAELLSEAEQDLLLSSARIVIDPRRGSVFEQVTRHLRQDPLPPPPEAPEAARPPERTRHPNPDVERFNGIGGFSDDGRVYVVSLGLGQWTPMPWVNVIANASFGFLVTESGGGYTWAGNARENQLTPWSNDPVCDPPGEVLYLRDADTGELWTPTPLPIREDTPYTVRHGQGWTAFDHEGHQLASTLTQLVMPGAPVKLSHLRLRNLSGSTRRIAVTAYVEWVLGSERTTDAPYVVTSHDAATGAIFARNPWRSDLPGSVAFLHLSDRPTALTADRAGFLGRNGSLAAPAALSGGGSVPPRFGAALDPCAALTVLLTILPGQTAELTVLLGQAPDEAAARALILRCAEEDPAAVLAEVTAGWDEVLDAVQVRTPDRELDLLVNRWLLYQTLSSRVWGRSAFYQAGGAYGFRDQLQDVMALAIALPDVARAHLLRAASRQYVEGDVQHWWHEPSGKGPRTRFTDDRLWLPYSLAHFLEVTGETSLLDVLVPFLEGPALTPEQQESYQHPTVSPLQASLYEHAARAIDISLGTGEHGLPLIGGGDWNDGMNRVGALGRGESVWLAWFLIANLGPWSALARARGELTRAEAWAAHAAALAVAVEAHGWDGAWYRRAYMDDGAPLGSATSVECRIDSIAQSWAVLSGGAPPDRARQAMASLDEHLTREADGVALLLTPPFDQTTLDPGYIRSYVPGIRENGGQYTHAAVWAVMAFAELGDGNQAGALLAMINPLRHARTRAGVQRYKVEPYVVAADVYGAAPHIGRGGWTWYTGAAAWMYRAALESILGVHLRGAVLHLAPCIPDDWSGFEVTLKLRGARFLLRVTNPDHVQRGIAALSLDGAPLDPTSGDVPLCFDGRAHEILLTLGPPQRVPAGPPHEPLARSPLLPDPDRITSLMASA